MHNRVVLKIQGGNLCNKKSKHKGSEGKIGQKNLLPFYKIRLRVDKSLSKIIEPVHDSAAKHLRSAVFHDNCSQATGT